MNRSQRTTFLILVILGVLYFVIFISPNLTGARDENMLSVFEHDEFAQYPQVIRMLTPGDTPYQTLRNFVVYLHYYYGYPFYFFSALAILPVKLLLGSTWVEHTSLMVMVFRQVINVLPMIISVLLLVWTQTRFRSKYKSILITLLLLTLPAVTSNNMWWHPDSLLMLFSALTIFFLERDDFRFGRNFYYSAITCGLAVGAKVLGVLFVLTYIVYILYGVFSRRISFKQVLIRAALFLLLMIATVVVTNPLLLLPIERSEIIAVFKANLQQNTLGFWVKGNSGISMVQQVYGIFNESYTSILLFLVSLGALIYGITQRPTRTASMVILTWVIGYVGYFLVFASTMRSHYLIPAALPMLSALVVLLPDSLKLKPSHPSSSRVVLQWRKAASFLLLLGILIQVGFNLATGVKNVVSVQNREETSASISLYRQAEGDVFATLQLERKVKVYRDWRAYVAPRDNYSISINWDLATYPYIQDLNPDVLFLERENMVYFSDASKIETAIDPTRMREMVSFYSDAMNDQVDGYTLVLKTDFGSVFLLDAIAAR